VVGATGLLRTPEGLVLYTAVPVHFDGNLLGVALVGQRLDTVLSELKTSTLADITLYAADGSLLETTFTLSDETLPSLTLDVTLLNQVLSSVQQVVEVPVSIGSEPYRAAYVPFTYGPNTLGVLTATIPNSVPFATEVGRQVTSLLVSALTGAVVIAAFVGISHLTARVEKITQVAEALAAGSSYVRTGMEATDEVGALGQALDQYAEATQARHDKLRDMLRRQRREINYLMAVFESMPGGVIVQDDDGRVLLVNDTAQQLLGSQRLFEGTRIQEFTTIVTDVLGPSLAPGVYALGDPRRIDLDGRMLSAQAAAITSMSDVRLGTVILLRDITDHVQEEHARERLLARLSEDIHQPLAGLAQTGSRSPNELVHAFAREISRYSASLQKMIVEMRELHGYERQKAEHAQRPLRLDALIWAVANDWRQIAQAANLALHVIIEQKGLYVLGDESRLRWAVGNIVDNAVKYTPPGGALTLEIKGEHEGMAYLRVRDNGVGIARDELEQVFIRFYRGTPTTKDGRVIRVPGMGQGLSVAKQIIEAHGGSLRLKSKVHVGTAVYITLPLTAPVTYELPYFDDEAMEGETMRLPEDVDLDSFWTPR
jgi:two-component system sensor histidine kinase VicK